MADNIQKRFEQLHGKISDDKKLDIGEEGEPPVKRARKEPEDKAEMKVT